ncbi:MAG: dockerin type I repeat-containing protein [Acutalibacteraceae bacterium]
MKKNRKMQYAGRLLSLLLVLCMTMAFLPTTVFAGNGPSTGEYSYAWVHFCTHNEESGITETHTIWSRDGEGMETMPGVSYSEATNTLTLTDVNRPDYFLVTNEMGDDFKVELVGDNHLLYLYAYGYGWGGSVELTGSGSLTLNEKKTAACAPVTLEAEYSNAVFVADATVTLTIYKTSDIPYIVENNTTARSQNAIQFNGKTGDTGIAVNEIPKYKTLPVFYGVSAYPSTFYGYYTKENDDNTYVISELRRVDENGEETGEVTWQVYGLIAVEHPTVTTGNLIIKAEVLNEDPATQGYIKHDDTVSANELSVGSSSVRIVKNTATGQEYAYIVDWMENTYTLYELVAELKGFDYGWGAGDIWYAAPAEPTVTGSVYDELPAGYEQVAVGGTGFYIHTATGGSAEVFTQTPSAGGDTTGPQDTPSLGDMNGSGDLTVEDSMCLYLFVSGQQLLTAEQRAAADVDGDGALTVADALLLYRVVSGKMTL